MVSPAARTYRNLSARVRVFGLELGDWAVFAGLTGGLSVVSPSTLFNLAVLSGTLLWMSQVKAKKPEGFTAAWLAFRASPRLRLCRSEAGCE